ncbi:MAG: ECF-type sigma factor [Phycisphaerales bacterium]|jgi:RNA polymerase sigma factor (TIGR02999 family)|nr:ECF-type sigma factor [Phycisphaerales bacterium]
MDRSEATMLVQRAASGDARAVDDLLPLVYAELRAMAAAQLKNEREGHTLQPTALANEAYLKLVDTDRMEWEGRSHFLAVAAQAMRRILVDHARGRAREKRGGGRGRVALDFDAPASMELSPEDTLAIDDALRRLHTQSERQARLVELRFFGGLTEPEAAAMLGVSVRTAAGDWSMAKAWLRRELSRVGDDDDSGPA